MPEEYNCSYISVNNPRSLTAYNHGYRMRRMADEGFGKRVKERRQELGLTQVELAERVGISQVAIRKIETGGATRKGRLLAAALGVSLKWLEIGETDEAPEAPLPVPPAKHQSDWPFAADLLARILSLGDRGIGYIEHSLQAAVADAERLYGDQARDEARKAKKR
ncbi:helix-turn-helix domain-containing protein [Achromobacter aloeverae]